MWAKRNSSDPRQIKQKTTTVAANAPQRPAAASIRCIAESMLDPTVTFALTSDSTAESEPSPHSLITPPNSALPFASDARRIRAASARLIGLLEEKLITQIAAEISQSLPCAQPKKTPQPPQKPQAENGNRNSLPYAVSTTNPCGGPTSHSSTCTPKRTIANPPPPSPFPPFIQPRAPRTAPRTSTTSTVTAIQRPSSIRHRHAPQFTNLDVVGTGVGNTYQRRTSVAANDRRRCEENRAPATIQPQLGSRTTTTTGAFGANTGNDADNRSPAPPTQLRVEITEILYFDREFGQMCLFNAAALADTIRSLLTKAVGAKHACGGQKGHLSSEERDTSTLLATLNECVPSAVKNVPPPKGPSPSSVVATLIACGVRDLRITYDLLPPSSNPPSGDDEKQSETAVVAARGNQNDDAVTRVRLDAEGNVCGADLLIPIKRAALLRETEEGISSTAMAEGMGPLAYEEETRAAAFSSEKMSSPVANEAHRSDVSEGSKSLDVTLNSESGILSSSYYAVIKRVKQRTPLSASVREELSERNVEDALRSAPKAAHAPQSKVKSKPNDDEFMEGLESLQESNRSSQTRRLRRENDEEDSVVLGEANFHVSTGTSSVAGSRVVFYGQIRPNSSRQSIRDPMPTISNQPTAHCGDDISEELKPASTQPSPSSGTASESDGLHHHAAVPLLKRKRTLPNLASPVEIHDSDSHTSANACDTTQAYPVFTESNPEEDQEDASPFASAPSDDEPPPFIRSINRRSTCDSAASDGFPPSFVRPNLNARRETIAPNSVAAFFQNITSEKNTTSDNELGKPPRHDFKNVANGRIGAAPSTHLRVALSSHFRPVTPAELTQQQIFYGTADRVHRAMSAQGAKRATAARQQLMEESMEVPDEVREVQRVWKKMEADEAAEREYLKNITPWNIPLPKPEVEGYTLAESAFFLSYLNKRKRQTSANEIHTPIHACASPSPSTSPTGSSSSSRPSSELSFVSRVWRAGGRTGAPRRSSALSIETRSSSFNQSVNQHW